MGPLASSFPSSLIQNCKTALYQIGSYPQTGEAVGRAGQEFAQPPAVVQGPDIELDIKTTEDKLCDKFKHSVSFEKEDWVTSLG